MGCLSVAHSAQSGFTGFFILLFSEGRFFMGSFQHHSAKEFYRQIHVAFQYLLLL